LAPTEFRRAWDVPLDEMRFACRFLTQGKQFSSLLSELKSAAAMARLLLRHRPRAIVCGGYNSLAAWVSLTWCKLARRRFVLWLEGTTRDNRKPGLLKTWLKNLFVSTADAIAAAGTSTVEYVATLGAREEQIFLAPICIDNDFFAREARKVRREVEKRAWGYPQRLILYSGRLDEKKGVFVLLEAFARVSVELQDVGLLIVGHGPRQEPMEHFCRRLNLKRVYFAGFRKYREMPYFYALADIVVLPTFSDTWGMVVNEAFACGVPAVVSKVAGACEDLLIDGATGFTVTPGDPAELADRMLQILKDEPLRLRMGANCRALIQKYSPEACAQGLLNAALTP
jgi:glycosyltransferase involved in cell wall biosynthesis